MAKKRYVYLSDEDRINLEALTTKGKSSARAQRRARVLLLLDRSQGHERTLGQVAEAAMCSQGMVSYVKRQYFDGGWQDAVYDRPRPGAAPKITGEVEAHLIATACSEPPEGHARWTLRLLADRLVELELVDSISHVAVGNALKKTKLSLGE